MQVWSLGREDPLEQDMATHSSILAWRIPRTSHDSQTQLKRLSMQAHTPKGAIHLFLRIGILVLETGDDPPSAHFKGTMLIWLYTF